MREAAHKVMGLVRLIAWLGVVFALTAPGYAQSANCNQLVRSLNALNRNRDFRELDANTAKARTLAAQLQAAESQFVRTGCQRMLNARQQLSAQCRAIAQQILSGRSDYARLKSSVDTGQAVAQQREATLQQMARFSCSAQSQATFTDQLSPGNQSPFSNFLDRVFGGGNQVIEDDSAWFGQQTLRTVCVRTCDGYYWPVSFSTLPQFLSTDANQCASQCPGQETQLFYYHNPGEDADQMVDLNGTPYSQMPYAFAYRKSVDKACACKAAVTYGSIQLASASDAGPQRAMVDFNGQEFPLPLRDPRRTTHTVTAKVNFIPLPRPRPARAGEEGYAAKPAASIPQISAATWAKMRLIVSHDRVVRIVGPDTPYVQAAEEGS